MALAGDWAVHPHPQRLGWATATLQVADSSAAGARTVQLTASGRETKAGKYFALPPTRIADTRNGTGGYTSARNTENAMVHMPLCS